MAVSIRPFLAGDVVQLDLQHSQHLTLGVHKAMHTLEDGQLLEAAGPAWTAIAANGSQGGRVVCCYGFAFMFEPAPGYGGHALAWALLAQGIGAVHLAVTRFARETIAASPIERIEALVRDDAPAECRWAELVGFELGAVLRRWGPEGRTHRLYERVLDGLPPSTPTVGSRALCLEAMGAV